MKTTRKKWIIGSATLVIVLALLVATMGSSIMARIAPNQYVLLSLLNMQNDTQNETKYTQIIRAKNKKTRIDLNVQEINGLDDYYKEIISGLGISLSASSNEAQEIIVDANLKKHNANLVDLSLYSSNEDFGVKIPGLLDQYVIVNLEQFKQQYDQTNLSAFLGPLDGEDVDDFKNSVGQTRKAITGQLADSYDQLNKDYQGAIETLAKTMNSKFIATTKFEVNNKTRKANMFSIHLDSKDIIGFQEEMIRATFSNDYIAKNIELASQLSGENYRPLQIQDLLFQALSKSSISDVQINCIIDNKKQILQAEITGQIRSNHNFEFYVKANISQGLLFKLQEDQVDIFKANLQLKKDFETKDYNRNLIADITLAQNPNLNIKLSGGLSIENLKDTPLIITNEQKLDLFSLAGVQMLDLMVRLGSHFYQLGNLL